MTRMMLCGVLVLCAPARAWADTATTLTEMRYLHGDNEAAVRACLPDRVPATLSPAQEHVCVLSVRALIQQRKFETARQRIALLQQRRGSRDWQTALHLVTGDAYFVEGDWSAAHAAYQLAATQAQGSELYPLILYNQARAAQYAGDLATTRTLLAHVIRRAPWGFEVEEARSILNDDAYLSVQVGAFHERDNAVRLLKELQQQGYTTYLRDAVKKDGAIFRVRVGRFTSYAAAKTMQDALGHRGYTTRIAP